jgi:DNA polymerase I
MAELKTSTDWEHLVSTLRSDVMVSVTAPLEIHDRIMIGYAVSPEEAYCANLTVNEFVAISQSVYVHFSMPRAFHGLKRIWEFMDSRGLRTGKDRDKHIDIHKIIDTKLVAFLLDPDSAKEVVFGDKRIQEGLTLAHLAHRYLGHDYPYRITDIYEQGYPGLFPEILAQDARLIFRLALELPKRMSRELAKIYRCLELPLMVVLHNVHRMGIGFDAGTCAREIRIIERDMARLAQEITGGQKVDLKSHEKVYQFLVDRGLPLRLDPAYVRRKGIKDPLEKMAHVHPLVQKVLQFWDMGEDLGLLRELGVHERIHATWGQTRSRTSRVFARDPALQNVSRDHRHLFVPAPGHVLIKADYSQAQMRILAHLSGDPVLTAIFKDPDGDIHSETSRWLGLNDRDIAKEINFAICFGMGKDSLCKKINDLKQRQGRMDFIAPATAQSYINGFYAKFPKVKDFFEQEWKTLKDLPPKNRVVRSLIGRERRFPHRPKSEVQRQFRVTWPQQIEADLIKMAMVRLDRIFRRRKMGSRIVMMIHDALWVESPKEEAELAKYLMTKMMTTAAKLRVPLVVDFGK